MGKNHLMEFNNHYYKPLSRLAIEREHPQSEKGHLKATVNA